MSGTDSSFSDVNHLLPTGIAGLDHIPSGGLPAHHVFLIEMGGKELDEALQVLRPELPLLFMSGYPGEEVAQRGLLDPAASFIQKPFSPEQLVHRVRGLLDRKADGTSR